MNYLYKIAYLGKRELKPYQGYNSPWIVANENQVWTTEFKGYKGIRYSTENIRHNPVMILYNNEITNMGEVGLAPNTTMTRGFNWKVWYNPENKVALLAHENSPKEAYEDPVRLAEIQKTIDETYAKDPKFRHLPYPT